MRIGRCDKRGFRSVAEARHAHRRAGYRLRVYRCPMCGDYHTTNADKHKQGGYQDPVRRTSGSRGRELAPTMTLEQLEAEARKRRGGAA